MDDLDGEAVIITGAGRGLGAAYAHAIAAAGAPVMINDVHSESAEAVAAEIRATGGRAVAEPGDVRDPETAQAMVDRCVAEYGFVSGLVNNAAVCKMEPFLDTKLEDLRLMLEVNVLGVFNCARAALPPMLRQGRGSIVNATSGSNAGLNGLSCYGATKGAVASFTYAWASELRNTGIRVNAISPMAATQMSGHNPHLPPPEVSAPLAVYLLSKRSQGVTGQVVRIHGRKLSLMAHPANRAPVLEHDAWTTQLIAEAFDQQLAAMQLPTGVATYDIVRVTA